jgi:hypothetical protein
VEGREFASHQNQGISPSPNHPSRLGAYQPKRLWNFISSLIYNGMVTCFHGSMVDVLECTGYLDQSEHVIAHATFHGNWFAIFVFNPGCSSFS